MVRSRVPVVCVGASAGGLRALESFFLHVPMDSGCAFVVVQHLSPDFRSLMDDLLGRWTKMRILRVVEDMLIEANTVYLIPPGKLMTMDAERLHLRGRPADRLGGQPIDVFLFAMVEVMGAHCAAVILSGTGSDGAAGLQAVHVAGGLAIVQDLESAEFDGMPRSAIATRAVDYVLPPEKMGKALLSFLHSPLVRLAATDFASGDMPDVLSGEYGSIFTLMRQAFGMDFSKYKLPTVERRIQRRMALNGVVDLEAYAALIEGKRTELDLLYNDLLIGVTEFFRDPGAFELLQREVYEPMLRDPSRKELRVWIAGCATGEEAYTHAILTDEAARAAGYEGRITIFATDAHRTSVEHAAVGCYPRERLERLGEVRIGRYFREERDGGMRIVPELRQRVIFAPHNLINDPPFTKLDVVSCRNLLIYLSAETQERVIGLFHFSLQRGGVLFLGSSEGLGRFENDFDVVDGKSKLFRRGAAPAVGALEIGGRSVPRHTRKAALLAPPLLAGLPKGLLSAYDHLLAKHLPPGFVISNTGEILHYIGDGARYLPRPSGRAQDGLIQRATGDLRLALTTLIAKVGAETAPAVAKGLRVEVEGGTTELVDLSVAPVVVDRTTGFLLHVSLTNTRPVAELLPVDAAAAQPFPKADAYSQRITDLESELQAAKDTLQATVEELQTTNEELQATNEEMLASNEELQSTNEELHSVNEELYTVNAEFEQKNHELKQLNADLDNILESIDSGTLLLDRAERIRKFNPAIETIFRLRPQDIGRPIEDIAYHLADQETMLHEIRSVLKTGEAIESECRTRDGHWFLKRVLPFFGSHRDIDGVVLTFTRTDSIKEVQEKLDFAMVSAQLAWWEWNVVTDRLVTYSPERCILGFRLDALTPKSTTWISLTHPDDLPQVMASLKDCLERKTSSWECEHRLRDADGVWRWVMNKGRVTKRGADGQAISMLGTTQNVHARHEAEATIAKLHRAIEQADISVMITDTAGMIEFVNPCFTRITGYEAAEVVGKTPRILRSSQTPAAVHTDLWATITRGERWRGEMRNRRKDGSLYWERATITPVRESGGRIAHFIAVKEDITLLHTEEEHRQRLEHQLAQSQKMETLGTLAGGIAHDFNNLLTAILGYAQIGRDLLPTENPAQESFHCIETAGQRAADLVRRILAFSRHHAPDRESLVLGSLCEQAVPLLRSSIPTTIDLVFSDKSDGALVQVDATQLQQVLLNLCTNAAQAISPRAGLIRVTVERVVVDEPVVLSAGALTPRVYAVLLVEDDGVGIPVAVMDRIFEPFFTTKNVGEGTGLGLSIVHTAVLAHDGAIEVLSTVGQGTIFKIYLPVSDQTAVMLPPPPTARLSRGQGQRIAVIDDEESISKLSAITLRKWGYEPVVHKDPVACLNAITAEPSAFALVLTDQTMPGLTGLELTAAIRAKGLRHPVIIASGYATTLNPASLIELGNAVFLPKPFSIADLLRVVQQMLPTVAETAVSRPA